MGAVYLARDPRFERLVAIKVLNRQFVTDAAFKARFDREAHAIASLEHSAIVPVHDYGEEEGEPYLVFRLMEGGSLAERLAQAPLPAEEVVRIVTRIAGALDYAHVRGIVHRDIKPANILFDRDGDAWLTDFGIAKLTEEASTLTGIGLVGSPTYMSPEQCEGEPATAASDIYSLGCTTYEAFTGVPPFVAESALALLLKHLHEPPPLATLPDAPLPEEINAALRAAMAKDPAERPPRALAFARALAEAADVRITPSMAGVSVGPGALTSTRVRQGDTAVTSSPALARMGTQQEGRRRWFLFAAAFGVAAIVAGTAAFLLMSGGGSADDEPSLSTGPAAGPPSSGALKVSAGGAHSCAVTRASLVTCWGEDDSGQANPPPERFRRVSAGTSHSCGVRTNQELYCWGSNDAGESEPPPGQFFEVASGVSHSCGLRVDGTITCWGVGTAKPPEGKFTEIAAGVRTDCAVAPGRVACWGDQEDLTLTPMFREAVHVAVGAAHVCTIINTGAVYCAGNNDAGQGIAPPGTFKEISAGLTHSCAIRSDDALVCWGKSSDTSRVPQPPGGAYFGLSSFAGGSHNCAIRLFDEGVDCWD